MSALLEISAERTFPKQAVYPPKVKLTPINYVSDTNQEEYSRDIGRSFELGDKIFYIFGDTFCKKNGDYVGFENNTAAFVPLRHFPLKSSYLQIKDDGVVEPLVPYSEEEVEEMAQDKTIKRMTFWGFGGVAQMYEDVGLHWFQKRVEYDDDGRDAEYKGVGLAKINLDKECSTYVTERRPVWLFGPDEPRIGSFSCLVIEPYFYLWGDKDWDIILSRVPINYAEERKCYQFWDGKRWVDDWQKAVPVFKDMQSGQIFFSPLFGLDRPWVFVGCNRWADNQIQLGASEKVEGPWELFPVAETRNLEGPEEFRYCVYPHPWAFDQSKGELMVTWSEQWPGGVIAGRLKFATIDGYDEEGDFRPELTSSGIFVP